MKTFIVTEIGKAFGRLKATLVFMVKALLIALVNIAFWLLPLFLMGYFTLKPIIADWNATSPASPAAAPGTPLPHREPVYAENKRMDFESFLRSVRSFVRELRTVGR